MRRSGPHKANWIRQLQAEGLTYSIVVIQGLPSAEGLSEAEIGWIAYFRKMGCPLTNLTDGGEGGAWNRGHKMSPEVVERLRRAHRGLRPSQDTRIKMSRAHGGRQVIDQYGTVYPSSSEAARILALKVQNVSAVARGEAKSTGGFVFRFVT